MPLYEYARSACDSRFERLQPMSVARESDRPECGLAAKRALSGTATPAPNPATPSSGADANPSG